jgi:hypothetical protein
MLYMGYKQFQKRKKAKKKKKKKLLLGSSHGRDNGLMLKISWALNIKFLVFLNPMHLWQKLLRT